MSRPRGHAALMAEAKRLGTPVTDLLVLARSNDPFVKGSPAQVRDAEWFAELHEGVQVRHLRRLHYQALSLEVERPDGGPYENTDVCWSRLVAAGAAARILGTVDPTLIVDARNPAPRINFDARQPPEPWVDMELPEFRDYRPWLIPHLDYGLPRVLFRLPEATVYGYEWEPGDQPVHVEVWCEKTTMDDILVPLCRRLDVNYRSGPGFASITNAVDLVRRAATDRPVRIYYISDFDPAGAAMPRAVARQVEYWSDDGLDIGLTPLVLTREQVTDLELPRIPIKESDYRRGKFEATNGQGAVELDALEALHSGRLARIVADAVAEHRDDSITDLLMETDSEAQATANDQWETETAPLRAELEELADEVNEVLDSYRDELADIAGRFEDDLGDRRQRLADLRGKVEDLAREFAPDLPDRPAPQVPANGQHWLYLHQRPWLDQLAAYHGNGDG